MSVLPSTYCTPHVSVACSTHYILHSVAYSTHYILHTAIDCGLWLIISLGSVRGTLVFCFFLVVGKWKFSWWCFSFWYKWTWIKLKLEKIIYRWNQAKGENSYYVQLGVMCICFWSFHYLQRFKLDCKFIKTNHKFRERFQGHDSLNKDCEMQRIILQQNWHHVIFNLTLKVLTSV